MTRDFDTLFDRLMGGWLAPFDEDLRSMRVWDFDVAENDQEVRVRVEIPGFEENELDVQLSNDRLTIKAEKEVKCEGREEYRSFYRTVTLPSGINTEEAQATYRNGVLELHIPREKGAAPKHIKIQGHPGNGGQRAPKKSEGTASEKAKK
jgi:HSP20 family protein